MSAADLAADAWMVARLRGDATLMALLTGGFYLEPAPPDAGPIVGTYTRIPVPDVNSQGHTRILTRGLWDVLVWFDNHADQDDVTAAVDRIDTLLTHTATTGLIVDVWREAPTGRSPDRDGDRTWRCVGGRYRFDIHP